MVTDSRMGTSDTILAASPEVEVDSPRIERDRSQIKVATALFENRVIFAHDSSYGTQDVPLRQMTSSMDNLIISFTA